MSGEQNVWGRLLVLCDFLVLSGRATVSEFHGLRKPEESVLKFVTLISCRSEGEAL